MRRKRKIIIGLAALALPLGAVSALGTPAFAKTPTNSIVCTGFGATITFHSPYVYTKTLDGHSNVQGVATTAKLGGTTSVVGNPFSCSGGTSGSSLTTNNTFTNLTIAASKNSKLSHTDFRYNKTTKVKYVYGEAASFFSSGAKSLKKSLKNNTYHINGHTTGFKQSGTPTLVTGNNPCPGEVGYIIHGKVNSGSHGDYYYDKTAALDVCLGTDTGTNVSHNFLADLLAMKGPHYPATDVTITGATIDPAHGSATL